MEPTSTTGDFASEKLQGSPEAAVAGAQENTQEDAHSPIDDIRDDISIDSEDLLEDFLEERVKRVLGFHTKYPSKQIKFTRKTDPNMHVLRQRTLRASKVALVC